MKKYIAILFVLLLILSMGLIVHARTSSLALTDDTLVTGDSMLRCLSSSKSYKTLLLTAAGGTCSFAIIEDGVTVTTKSVDTTTEKWVTTHPSQTFKVDWTAGTGTCTGATLQCSEE